MASNSAGSTVGKRKRWARTAFTGSAKTMSSPPLSRPAASFKSATWRTSQVPLPSRARTRFQPLSEGVIKTESDAGSILQFLPTNHLRTSAFSNNHLDHARCVAGFSDAHHAHHRVFESEQAGLFKLRTLLLRESYRKQN